MNNRENILIVSVSWISKEDIQMMTLILLNYICVFVIFLTVIGGFETLLFLIEFFFKGDIMAIISIPISITNKKDSFLWHFDKIGVYMVKSAYFMYMDLLERSFLNVEGEL